jgi:hypothetical protein
MEQIKFGRSVIYYGTEKLNRDVMRFIESQGRWQGKQAQSGRKGVGRQQDPEERRRVEEAAVKHATAYYRKKLGDNSCVTSVEKECKGWDLEVRQRSGELLYVEVKGSSGSEPGADLTVKEYEKLCDPKIQNRYVIYIVTEAGTRNARGHIFRFREKSGSVGSWVSDDGRALDFERLVAARITVSRTKRQIA